LSTGRLDQWFAAYWGVEEPALGTELIARGFTSYSEFIEVARSGYVYQRMLGSS
jgi:hypothetical protein